MDFWLTVIFLLLIYLVILLIRRIMEDKHVKQARQEMPGKVRNYFVFSL